MAILYTLFILLAAYLIGSLSSAVIVCKAMGLPDPRTLGSQNPGATNVLRIGGKKAALLTLAGDTLKGFLPVFIAKCISTHNDLASMIALAAFLGHLFPVFFGFKGGKGVATALGGWMAISYGAGLCWMATWAAAACLWRYSSLAALTASLVMPIYIAYFTRNIFVTAVTVIMSLLLSYRHHENIRRLLMGKETAIGKKSR